MDRFEYRGGDLFCEQSSVAELAERYGTPLFIYSQGTLTDHFERMRSAFAPLNPLICYSVKCCQNVHICRLLAERGCGFDVVSGGELHRALRAGGDPAKIVFAGVGKTRREILEGIDAGIAWFNVESESEMAQLAAVAAERRTEIRCALRVNPDVDPKTHVYTTTGKKETKFGVDHEHARRVFREFARRPYVRLTAIHLHIGSPVNDVEAYRASLERALSLIEQLRADGFTLDAIDVGGGFGAHYAGSEAPPASEYARVIVPMLQSANLRVILEPGRSIAGNAGILVGRVLHTKQSGTKRFVILDASMTELIRPALYGAYHFIWPVRAGSRVPMTRAADQPFADLLECNVVGPVCESGDFLARDRRLPPVAQSDLLAVFTAGAYAMSMSSQYNSRPRAAEVLVDGTAHRLIRRRETYDDLIAAELAV